MWPLNKIQFGMGIVVGLLVSFGLHSITMAYVDWKHGIELESQQKSLEKKCKANKSITKGANDAVQKGYADNHKRASDYERLHPTSPLVANSGKTVIEASGGGHAGKDGTASDIQWYRDFARECNDYRTDRIVLDRWADAVIAESNVE